MASAGWMMLLICPARMPRSATALKLMMVWALHRRAFRGSLLELVEHARCGFGRFFQRLFVRVEQMGDEQRMLFHLVGPEGDHLAPVEARVAAIELGEAAREARCFLAQVLVERRPGE